MIIVRYKYRSVSGCSKFVIFSAMVVTATMTRCSNKIQKGERSAKTNLRNVGLCFLC